MAQPVRNPQEDVADITSKDTNPESHKGIDSFKAQSFDQPTEPSEAPVTDIQRPIKDEDIQGKYLSSSLGLHNASKSGASSFIRDCGDALQLGFTANSSRFATSAEPSVSSDREDENSGSEEVPSGEASTEVSDIGDENNNKATQTTTLLSRLRLARVPSTESDGSYFFPLDKLDELVTRENIANELKSLKIVSRNQRSRLSAQIWKGPSPDHKTTRRKIFALLVLMGKVEAIMDFVSEGVYDSNLPFIFAEHQVCCKKDGKPMEFFQDETKWKPHEKDILDKYQWEMMTPYFELSYEGQKKVKRMPLEDRAALPFTEVDNIAIESGFSMVRKVKIHTAHYNANDFTSPGEETPFFAVKTLSFGADVSVLENQEVQSLIRLSNENHPNLIRLLVTFQHKDHLHLVFPWADGNLQDFWKKEYPDPHNPARDSDLAQWVAQQCLGLALGLKAIHHNCVDRLQAWEQHLPSDASQKKHGRHGDFKPENILWYKQNGTSSANSVTGILKVSDFGFADFHASLSKSDIPLSRLRGMTPTYRAPEWDVTEKVSPAYDIWCFGCVLLEFVEWYLHGWQGVKDFEEKRIKDSIHVLAHYREDNFFNFPETRDEMRRAVAKESVRLEIQDLRHHKKCSDFILDLLHCIEYHFLRMRPQKRASCDSVVGILQEIWEKCKADPTYCTERHRSIPEKRKTDLSELALRLPLKFKEIDLSAFAVLQHTKFPGGDNAVEHSNETTPSVTVASNRSSADFNSSESIHRYVATVSGGSFPSPTLAGSTPRLGRQIPDGTSSTAALPPSGLGIVREEPDTDPNLLNVPNTGPRSEHSDNTLEGSTANAKENNKENALADGDADLVAEDEGVMQQRRDENTDERTSGDSQQQADTHVAKETRAKGKFERYVKIPFMWFLSCGKP